MAVFGDEDSCLIRNSSAASAQRSEVDGGRQAKRHRFPRLEASRSPHRSSFIPCELQTTGHYNSLSSSNCEKMTALRALGASLILGLHMALAQFSKSAPCTIGRSDKVLLAKDRLSEDFSLVSRLGQDPDLDTSI